MTADRRQHDAAEASRVHAALADHLRSRRRVVSDIDPRVDELAGLLAGFVLSGGKRIRPRVALAGWAAATGEDGPAPTAVVTACAALEFIQACALIHDDIVDASDTRRGRPTVHRQAEALHERAGWSGDSGRYGVSQAILLGDLALSWAEEMFVGSGVEPGALQRAMHPWHGMKTEVLAGQMLDILAEAAGATDEHTPRRVNRYKTAAYTVERPVHIGAALGGAGPEAIEALREFGVAVGQAFQLRDDMLGIFGDPDVTGKPSGDDLREGKRTLVLARASALATPGDADFLAGILGGGLTDEQLERARAVLVDCGAVASVEAEIDDLVTRAAEVLRDAPIAEVGRQRLGALADAATRRTA